jgi:hypothetical protein
MAEVSRDELAAMTDQELLAYEREQPRRPLHEPPEGERDAAGSPAAGMGLASDEAAGPVGRRSAFGRFCRRVLLVDLRRAGRCSGWCTSPAGGGWPTVSASPSAKLSTRRSRRGPTRSRPGS